MSPYPFAGLLLHIDPHRYLSLVFCLTVSPICIKLFYMHRGRSFKKYWHAYILYEYGEVIHEVCWVSKKGVLEKL